ncbi:hypothetical protein BSKO_13817 [Bryopsis sp. KO-2023]|nr:hypothetical protein BSKO_13817 [Bryopsis sp. KO-2023]
MQSTKTCPGARAGLRGAFGVERQTRACLIAGRAGHRDDSTSTGSRAYEGGDDIIFGGRNVGGSLEVATCDFGVRFQPDFSDILSCVQLNRDEDPWREQERMDDIRSMTKKSLQAACRKHGLKIQGGREELIARIISFESSHPESVKTDTSTPRLDDIFVGLA